jgi:hypothetical protein
MSADAAPPGSAQRGAFIPPLLLALALGAAALSFLVHVPACRASHAYGVAFVCAFPVMLGLIVVLGGATLMRGGSVATVAACYLLTAPAFVNWVFNLGPTIHGLRT